MTASITSFRLLQSFVLATVIAYPLITTSASAAILDANEYSMMAEVDNLIHEEIPEELKFEQLEHAVQQFRDGRVTFENGDWKLSSFYNCVGSLVPNRMLGNFYERWQRQYPNSPAPKLLVAQAQIYGAMGPMNQALGVGGTSQNWEIKPDEVASAREHLVSIRSFAEVDPYWYVLWARLSLIDTRNDTQFSETVLTGIRKYPRYDDLYVSASDYFLPKWGGSSSLLDTWARRVASETKDVAGANAYVRTYLHAMRVQYGTSFFKSSRVDWADMKSEGAKLIQTYPSMKNVARMTTVACMAGDHAEAARLVSLNPELGYLGEWLSNDDREACVSWAKRSWWDIEFEKGYNSFLALLDRAIVLVWSLEAAIEQLILTTLDHLAKRGASIVEAQG